MDNKIINKLNGEFSIAEDLTLSHKTTLQDLQNYFDKKTLKKSPYAGNCYYTDQIKIDDLYFKFSFFFEKNVLSSIEFEIEEEPIERIPWSNNRDLETNWIADQMGESFVWDMKIAGRHFKLSYDWGFVGVFYDFKNGTFQSVLSYSK